MNTPIILTGEIGFVVVLVAIPLILVGRQALREGWVKGSGNFAIVPPGRRWDDTRKNAAAGVADSPAGEAVAPVTLAAAPGERKRREG